MTNDTLTGRIASTMLQAIKEERGRLTAVSDMCSINRQEFDVEGLSKMSLSRLIRLGAAMAIIMPKKRYIQMTQDISEIFQQTVDYLEDLNSSELKKQIRL